MSKELINILDKIQLVSRYTELCSRFDNFENRMKNATIEELSLLLKELGVELIFNKNGSFFSLVSTFSNIESTMNITLKGGLVEPLLYIKINGETKSPNGRLDFISQEIDELFDRMKYNLAKYTNLEELKSIIIFLFSLFWEINYELTRNHHSLANYQI